MRSYNLDYGRSYDSDQGFPCESSFHIVYKVLYVNSFYSLYFYHLYADLCLFVCVIADSKYADNSKPIFLFL